MIPQRGLIANFSVSLPAGTATNATANATSTSPSSTIQFPAPPAPQLQAGPTRAVSAATYADLLAAVADPTVGTITLTADVELRGAPLNVSGPSRALALRGDAAACAAFAPLAPAFAAAVDATAAASSAAGAPAAAVPTRPCVIDAKGLSQLFTISNGASLSLDSLLLANGAGLMGGAVRAAGGSAVAAARTVFFGSVSTGGGGAVFGVGGCALEFTDCAFVNNTAQAGAGGSVGALHGTTLALTRTTFSGSLSQWSFGGAVSAAESSRVTVSASSFARGDVTRGSPPPGLNATFAALGAGFLSISRNSTGFITDSGFSGGTCSRWGGAVLVSWNSTVRVSGSNFTDNWRVRRARDDMCSRINPHLSSSPLPHKQSSFATGSMLTPRPAFSGCPSRRMILVPPQGGQGRGVRRRHLLLADIPQEHDDAAQHGHARRGLRVHPSAVRLAHGGQQLHQQCAQQTTCPPLLLPTLMRQVTHHSGTNHSPPAPPRPHQRNRHGHVPGSGRWHRRRRRPEHLRLRQHNAHAHSL